MSRPGNYGKSSRLKQLRQIRRRKQQQTSRTIHWDQVEDFLLGRYHLVQGSQLPPVVDATIQRFFSEWLQTALAQGEAQIQWDVTALTTTTLQRIGNQVPWQFYGLLAGQAEHWQKFLRREGPVLPLSHPRQIINPLSMADWQQLIANQLADNLLTVSAIPVTAKQREQLTASFLVAGHLQWTAVAALFTPLGFQITSGTAAETSQWLNQLSGLTVADFHQ
ncbi:MULTISPECIES: hypothetical protein [Lactobacillaceae]|uniref:hypothetical protein n=1 Tax=Lactobacillaceae TaxID=33958 RepID=UPI001456BB69|nr:hypothetical protein [Lactobacillus sp. HBUAS51381]NLR10603.1 hypothetical protein [Lactobacillus sp. HBUAS51381]